MIVMTERALRPDMSRSDVEAHLVALAKAPASKLNYASSGIGNDSTRRPTGTCGMDTAISPVRKKVSSR